MPLTQIQIILIRLFLGAAILFASTCLAGEAAPANEHHPDSAAIAGQYGN